MMGMAVGCIGISMAEFMAMEPDEFGHVCRAWQRMHDDRERAEWERMRLSATIGIQPHVRKKLTPRQLVPLPWDSEGKKNRLKQPEPSAEEKKRRFEELTHR